MSAFLAGLLLGGGIVFVACAVAFVLAERHALRRFPPKVANDFYGHHRARGRDVLVLDWDGPIRSRTTRERERALGPDWVADGERNDEAVRTLRSAAG